MENLANNYTHIKGWGIDADPENDPTYPIKKYTGDDHKRLNYERPVQQPDDGIEVLISSERPGLTAVFGTSTPPSGLSGMIRRYAFKFSESSYGHWLPLLIADRVNVVEGILQDLARGYIPNFFLERGGKAGWKHNPRFKAKTIIVGVILTSAVVSVLFKKKKKGPKRAIKRLGSVASI